MTVWLFEGQCNVRKVDSLCYALLCFILSDCIIIWGAMQCITRTVDTLGYVILCYILRDCVIMRGATQCKKGRQSMLCYIMSGCIIMWGATQCSIRKIDSLCYAMLYTEWLYNYLRGNTMWFKKGRQYTMLCYILSDCIIMWGATQYSIRKVDSLYYAMLCYALLC